MLIKKPLNPIELNSIVVSLASQKFESTCIQCFKTSHLRVKSEENVSWTLDGEFGGYHKEVVIKVEQKALSIIIKQKV